MIVRAPNAMVGWSKTRKLEIKFALLDYVVLRYDKKECEFLSPNLSINLTGVCIF